MGLSPACGLLLAATTCIITGLVGGREYCWETFNATCPTGHVILMRSASYGRMAEGRCVVQGFDHIGCSSDVLSNMDERCSGRRSCSLDIPATELHMAQPCPKDLGTYLDAEFDCVKVAHHRQGRCGAGRDIEAPGPSGYLANVVTVETHYGSATCPWIIMAPQGQRVNLTLLDFAVASGSHGQTNVCTKYAVIKEGTRTSTDITVCGGDVREKAVYLSETNKVQVIIKATAKNDLPHFLLKYEVVGCVDVPSPEFGWARRQGNKMTVSCNHTGERWHLVCSGSSWVGDLHNCSAGAHSDEIGATKAPVPFGLVLAVIVGVVLGVLIGSALLGIVLYCQRRLTKKSRCRVPVQCQTVVESDDPEKARMLRPGNYGYAHVWELQHLRAGAEIEAEVPFNKMDVVQVAGTTEFGTHLGRPPGSRSPHVTRDHTYECPRFAHSQRQPRGVIVTTRPDTGTGTPFYHEFLEETNLTNTMTPTQQRSRQDSLQARYTD